MVAELPIITFPENGWLEEETVKHVFFFFSNIIRWDREYHCICFVYFIWRLECLTFRGLSCFCDVNAGGWAGQRAAVQQVFMADNPQLVRPVGIRVADRLGDHRSDQSRGLRHQSTQSTLLILHPSYHSASVCTSERRVELIFVYWTMLSGVGWEYHEKIPLGYIVSPNCSTGPPAPLLRYEASLITALPLIS